MDIWKMKNLLRQLFEPKEGKPRKNVKTKTDVQFYAVERNKTNTTFRLADIEQSIGGVRQLTGTAIEEMVARKHDLDFQYSICRQLIAEQDILPFPFERAVILLRKAKRIDDERKLCRYVAKWCDHAEKTWDGKSAKHWLSPSLRRIVARLEKLD